jgi:hypothetical protein
VGRKVARPVEHDLEDRLDVQQLTFLNIYIHKFKYNVTPGAKYLRTHFETRFFTSGNALPKMCFTFASNSVISIFFKLFDTFTSVGNIEMR